MIEPVPHPVWGYTDSQHIGELRGEELWVKPPYEAWRRAPVDKFLQASYPDWRYEHDKINPPRRWWQFCRRSA